VSLAGRERKENMAIPSPCLGEKVKAIKNIFLFHQEAFSHI
jgi:hypothetical protein